MADHLRRGSATARLLELRVRIPPGAWMSVSCECCVFSGRGLCVGLITHTEKSYRVLCVTVCDIEASIMRRPWPTRGYCAMGETIYIMFHQHRKKPEDIPMHTNYKLNINQHHRLRQSMWFQHKGRAVNIKAVNTF
jgi:hypothetical protein